MLADNAADRGRWIEPTLAALGALIVAVASPWDQPLLRVVDLIICIGAGLSARFPRAAAVVSGTALSVYLFFPPEDVSVAGLAVFINVFASFRLGLAWRIPITVVLTAIAYYALVQHAFTTDNDFRAPAMAVLLLLLSVAVAIGHGWHQSNRRLAIERVGAEERVSTIRVSLARDLHDTVAQTLSHAAMRAHMASMHPDATPELAAELELIAADCSSSSQDLRQLLRSLREHDQGEGPVGGPLADAESLRAVLDDQAGRLRSKGFFPVVRMDISAISAARATTLSKVAVEATSNMIKHAPPGSECRLEVSETDDNIVAEFCNPIAGRSVGREGLGVIGIEERVSLLGGRCTVERSRGVWQLRVTIPHGYERRSAAPAGPDDLSA